jgi:hypothetical protein
VNIPDPGFAAAAGRLHAPEIACFIFAHGNKYITNQ